MQDLPKGPDKKWREDAKQCLQKVQKVVSYEGACLTKILSKVELVALERFQEDFSNADADDKVDEI